MHDYKKGEVLRSGSAMNGTYWVVKDLAKGNFIILERLQWSKDIVHELGVMRCDGHVISRKVRPGGLILLEKNRGRVERHEKCKDIIVKD